MTEGIKLYLLTKQPFGSLEILWNISYRVVRIVPKKLWRWVVFAWKVNKFKQIMNTDFYVKILCTHAWLSLVLPIRQRPQSKRTSHLFSKNIPWPSNSPDLTLCAVIKRSGYQKNLDDLEEFMVGNWMAKYSRINFSNSMRRWVNYWK